MTVHKLLGKTNESQINQTEKIFLKPAEKEIVLEARKMLFGGWFEK